jgi:dTDP-4-dehydrorhamnose 3,5-epimerase/CDP-3, 6-dideoxy-D-glycero-D-glycero-4-hexulose-5-epimerase
MIHKEKSEIKGLNIITGSKFIDLRGMLLKPYSIDFLPLDIDFHIKEVWFSKSVKNVIRGMHLQIKPFECEKIISVIDGIVEDVVLDLRANSKTYGTYFSIVLSDENALSLLIPGGCAHGYKVLSEKAIVMYLGNEINVPRCDVGIRWDSFGYDWKIEKPILSKKDMKLPTFVTGKTIY